MTRQGYSMTTLLQRADAALAANGRGPAVRSYWLGSGWFVTDDPYACVPRWAGDRHWQTFVAALSGETPDQMGAAIRTRGMP